MSNPKVICPVCYRWVRLTTHRYYIYPHGPMHNRCKGSWNPPMPNQVQRSYVEELL
jgi:hypothetical protein